jgi:hypothetical protein
MPDTQVNVTQLNRGQFTTAPLRLLGLMRDLEVLGDELRIAEEMIGQPVWGYKIHLRSGYAAWELVIRGSKTSALGGGLFQA